MSVETVWVSAVASSHDFYCSNKTVFTTSSVSSGVVTIEVKAVEHKCVEDIKISSPVQMESFRESTLRVVGGIWNRTTGRGSRGTYLNRATQKGAELNC